MNFNKKLKLRLITAIVYIILGAALMVTFNIIKTENEVLSYLGFAFVIIGIARVRNYFLITQNEETIKRRQIAENDERNVSIANKAKSVAFLAYVVTVGLSVIVLLLFNMTQLAQLLSLTIAFIVLLYWISYFIISKKS